MQEYTGFAQVYDVFMDNVPYDEWSEYLTSLLRENGINDGLVLELGCGTGKITRRLATNGYDMIGIDSSEEMLEIAREKEYEDLESEEDLENEEDLEDEDDLEVEEELEDEDNLEDNLKDEGDLQEHENIFETNEKNCEAISKSENDSEISEKDEYFVQESVITHNNILYLQQDMRNFELYGTVAAVVSICDSMNYITSEQDLLQVFQLVNNYLDAKGIFIFDMNTEYKYKHILGDRTIAENRDDCSFIWENYYNKDSRINEYDITIYIKIEEDKNEENPVFERFQETHYQKAYSLETIKKLLEEAGMEYIAVYDALTHNSPTDTSERVYFIAREKYQEHKKYV